MPHTALSPTLSPPAPDPRVAQALDGDVRAFEGLYRDHVGRIYAFCLRSCAQVDRAENLTQETFVRAWKNLARFRHQSQFSSWLFSIALNLIRDEYRSEQRAASRRGRGSDDAEAEAEAPAHVHRHVGTAVDLERAIAQLPKKARIVFLLHDVYGHSHADVAQSLGVTEGTTKAQLSRARGLLRERLNA